jgi:hypothetical protein
MGAAKYRAKIGLPSAISLNKGTKGRTLQDYRNIKSAL